MGYGEILRKNIVYNWKVDYFNDNHDEPCY